MRCIIVLSLLIYLLSTPLSASAADEKISIEADQLLYENDQQDLVGSGNAIFTYQNQSIQSEYLRFSVSDHIIETDQPVLILDGTKSLTADNLFIDLDEDNMVLTNARMELSIDKVHDATLTAKHYVKNQDVITGEHAYFTTCKEAHKHYYIKASHFKYTPKQIISQNVFFYNEFFHIPFIFWSPAHIFELGKRQVVYLMPSIGSNSIEGQFYKSQLDYYFSENAYGNTYIDMMTKQGVGLGLRHNYGLNQPFSGSLYHYQIPNSPNQVWEWKQNSRLNQEFSVSHAYKDTNMYLLSGLSQEKNEKSVILDYNDLGDQHRLSVYENEQTYSNGNSSQQNQRVEYLQSYNGHTPWRFAATRSQSRYETRNFTLNENHHFANEFELENNILFQQQNTQLYSEFDNQLTTQTMIYKPLRGIGQTQTEISLFFDPDSVENDNPNYVNKTPEFTLNLDPYTWNNIKFNSIFQFGHYQESYLLDSGSIREFETDRYVLTQTANFTMQDNLPLNGKFSITEKLSQYYYATEDQNYTWTHILQYNTNSFNFFNTESNYTQTSSPSDGNSPFYFDNIEQKNVELLTEKWIFYYNNPYQYHFNVQTGYNFRLDQQLDYDFELLVAPSPTINWISKSGWQILNERYDPLSSYLNYRPNEHSNHRVSVIYNLNDGKTQSINHELTQIFGEDPDYRWSVTMKFTYQPSINKNYQIESISLIKNLECRKITMSYNRILEEFRFHFTINAFPDAGVGGTSNKYEDLKLDVKGIIDDTSVQRF